MEKEIRNLLKMTIDIASGAMMAQGLFIAVHKDQVILGFLFFMVGGTFAWKSLQRSFKGDKDDAKK